MRVIAGVLTLFLAPGGWGRATDDSSPVDRGVEALDRKDYDEAERQLRRAVRQSPDNARAQKLLGVVHAARGEYSAAVPPLQRACALDPDEENACFYLGRMYYHLGRYDESREVLEAVLRREPDRNEVERGLALTLEASGRTVEAERYFEKAARRGDRHPLTDYGLFLFRQGRLEESVRLLRRAGAREELARVERARAALPEAAALAPGADPEFAASEIEMVVRNGAAGNMHQIETMVSGVGVLDFDGDGWLDLYVANGAAVPSLAKADPSFFNRLFRNGRDGTFTDVTGRAGVAGRGYSMGVAAADHDNDGWPDLFVTGVAGNTLYRNRGDGTFEDVTAAAGVSGTGLWAVAAGWFDYDRDGFLDLFVANYVAWDPDTEPFCGNRRVGFRGYCHPRYYTPLPNVLYHNEGDGTFRDVSAESGIGAHLGKGMGVVFGDYDGDGLLDVFVGNDTTPNFLFRNLGEGRFREVALASGVAYNAHGLAVSSMGADFRDLDNDGLEDLFVTALSNEGFDLFRNLGDGFLHLSHPSRIGALSLPLSGWSTGAYDLNNDGLKDVFSANGFPGDNAEMTMSVESRQESCVFVNEGGGRFRRRSIAGKAMHRGAAFGDFDNDGLVDVVVTRLNDRPLLLRNVTKTGSHWLRLRLRGRLGNRDGIGAWIRVGTRAGSQWNRVTTSVGFAGSSEPIAHFGLGDDSGPHTVEIHWPSGTRQVLENVATDRCLVVDEPDGRDPPGDRVVRPCWSE